jgi:hypothetical protein
LHHTALEGPHNLGQSGVAELTLFNRGDGRDVYRLSLETDFYQPANAEPNIVALDPGRSQRVRVAACSPVVVHVYSESRGEEVTALFLSR